MTLPAGDTMRSWRNAETSESERTRYLPSFNVEIAYITTKNANSSVMKSEYETSQRSRPCCSSLTCLPSASRRFIAERLRSGEIAGQPRLDKLGILAAGNAEQAIE